MKITKIFAVSIICALLISSCSTTEKILVSAPTGTEIYNPAYLWKTNATGNGNSPVEVEVTSDMYLGYLLYKPAGSSLLIPYGVDYVTKKHFGTKSALVAGYGITSVGMLGLLVGTIMVCSGDEDVESQGVIFDGIGSGACLTGLGLGMPAQYRMRQTAYDYNFGYAKKQTFNLPELSMTLINPNPTKEEFSSPATVKQERKKATSAKVAASTDKGGSKVNRSRTDISKKISGEYVGKGKLLLKGSVDETYNSMVIMIESTDKNHVSVRILEGGEDFFEEPLIYTVKADKKGGGFSLVIDEVPEATIKISKAGVLSFNHKNVNIDNVIYTLTISGNKK
ncbi:MAG: hypothetical protein K2H48_02485 [Duncaniella sp.]|nr:hypothetical protein [Duncaniella sp.]